MIEEWFDVSNYTQRWDLPTCNYIQQRFKGVIIGLQSAPLARWFKAKAIELGLERGYYADILGRDLTIPEDGSICFIDIEAGCFTSQGDVQQEILDQLAEDVRVGIYGNETSILPVFPDASPLFQYPSYYANYGTPDFDRIAGAFGGRWPALLLQYSSGGFKSPSMPVACNADLAILRLPAPTPDPTPAPVEPALTHTVQIFDDGSIHVD